jgi:hypothetical protein
VEFPQPDPSDNDDVAWAIQTANTMYKRGDHAEAIRWLQRAADSAEEAGDDARLLTLARAAAEFAKAGKTSRPPPAPPAPARASAAAAPSTASAPPPANRSRPPPPGRSAPPPPKRSAPPPPPRTAPTPIMAIEDVLSTPVTARRAIKQPLEPPDNAPTPLAPPVAPIAPVQSAAAAAPPTNATPYARLQGLSATSTPTTPAISARATRVSDAALDEVTQIFEDPRRAAGMSGAAPTHAPNPARRSMPGGAPQAAHDSSPTPYRALRVCVLRATSPGTFLVRPLAPGEQLPPAGREALLVPLHAEDDFSR